MFLLLFLPVVFLLLLLLLRLLLLFLLVVAIDKVDALARKVDGTAVDWTAIDDELLDTMIPSGTFDEIAEVLLERYRGLATHITFPMPDDPADDARVSEVITALRS